MTQNPISRSRVLISASAVAATSAFPTPFIHAAVPIALRFTINGGSLENRIGRVACWNSSMGENRYLHRQWRRFALL